MYPVDGWPSVAVPLMLRPSANGVCDKSQEKATENESVAQKLDGAVDMVSAARIFALAVTCPPNTTGLGLLTPFKYDIQSASVRAVVLPVAVTGKFKGAIWLADAGNNDGCHIRSVSVGEADVTTGSHPGDPAGALLGRHAPQAMLGNTQKRMAHFIEFAPQQLSQISSCNR